MHLHIVTPLYHFISKLIFYIVRILLFLYNAAVSSTRSFKFISDENNVKRHYTFSSEIRKCCVIGGGPSGLAAIKHLTVDYGEWFEDCVLFESREKIGGIWNYESDGDSGGIAENVAADDLTAMYETLHTNTSKHLMSFTDFPMPQHYPDYPSQRQVLEYLNEYADHFGLHEHIQLRTRVISVSKCYSQKGDASHDKWRVVTQTEGECEQREHMFDAIFVCNGHLSAPHMPPRFNDEFARLYERGKFIHSKQYNHSAPFRNKRVVVVGVGSSGADIAAKIAPIARETIISVRPTATVRAKYTWGMPIDHATPRRIINLLPTRLKRLLVNLLVNWHQPSFGTHLNSSVSKNATGGLSTELLQQIGDGMVRVVREIERVDKDYVYFVDGSRSQPDYVVCCTGYQLHFPFFVIRDDGDGDEDVNRSSFALHIDRDNGRLLDLYKHVFHIDDPTCCFIGVPNRIKPFPVADLQVRWCCEVFSGQRRLPSQHLMRMENANKEQQMHKTGVQLRFWHRVDHVSYCEELSRLAGCHPDLTHWSNSDLLWPLLMWPLYPTCYRLSGTKNGGCKARKMFLSQSK